MGPFCTARTNCLRPKKSRGSRAWEARRNDGAWYGAAQLRPRGSLAFAATTAMATWGCQLRGVFEPYNAANNKIIEDAHRQNEDHAIIDISGKRYKITFSPRMLQISVADETKTRPVQRVAAPTPATAAAPTPPTAAAGKRKARATSDDEDDDPESDDEDDDPDDEDYEDVKPRLGKPKKFVGTNMLSASAASVPVLSAPSSLSIEVLHLAENANVVVFRDALGARANGMLREVMKLACPRFPDAGEGTMPDGRGRVSFPHDKVNTFLHAETRMVLKGRCTSCGQ